MERLLGYAGKDIHGYKQMTLVSKVLQYLLISNYIYKFIHDS